MRCLQFVLQSQLGSHWLLSDLTCLVNWVYSLSLLVTLPTHTWDGKKQWAGQRVEGAMGHGFAGVQLLMLT